MHPNELKNQALVAASLAKLEGFTATAEALFLLAHACAVKSQRLQSSAPETLEQISENSYQN